MAFFIPSATICETQEVNFFTSGNYATSSFSADWETRTIPDTENLTVVYLDVLDKFGITVDSSNGLPPGGTLPGIDIKNMDAIQAIRLSLAESLTVGQWWEVYEDANGAVFFSNVFDNGSPGKTINLNVRLCIPSVSKSNEVDMVIVHGYDSPPVVETRGFRDVVPAGTGQVNPGNVTGNESVFTIDTRQLLDTAHQSQLRHVVHKSYKDPVFADVFSPQEPNPFYEVQAFEEVITYIQRITGLPDDPGATSRVKYSFRPDTVWYKEIQFPSFTKTNNPSFAEELSGITTGGNITYYEGSLFYTGPLFTDRFAFSWPLVIRPTSILYAGSKIKNIELLSFANLAGNVEETSVVYTEPVKEFNELQPGSQWLYEIAGENQFEIKIFYASPSDPLFWDIILDAVQNATAVYKVFDGSTLSSDNVEGLVDATGAVGVLPAPNTFGYYVEKMWVEFSLDRPSVVIEHAFGDALQFAQSMQVEYAPLVKIDPPAPIAYKHKDEGSVIVDQSIGLQDNDPTTCQNFEDTPIAIMQNLQTGNTIEVSLPFCETAEVCLTVAETIFDYQTYSEAQTFTLTCAPDDEPELGAAVNGFDNNLRIESITHSYTDGSAYSIEVTLGPVFANIGSWNNGAWIRKTENVDREGIITWVAGDSINYRVAIQGLGEYNAINSTDRIFVSGERVQVRLYNVPVEE